MKMWVLFVLSLALCSLHSTAGFDHAANCAEQRRVWNANNPDIGTEFYCYAGFCSNRESRDIYSSVFCPTANRWCLALISPFFTAFGTFFTFVGEEYCGDYQLGAAGSSCNSNRQCRSGLCTAGVCDCSPSWGSGTGGCRSGKQCLGIGDKSTRNVCISRDRAVGETCNYNAQCDWGVCGTDKKCRCGGSCDTLSDWPNGPWEGCNGCQPRYQCIQYTNNNNRCVKFPVPFGKGCNYNDQCPPRKSSSGWNPGSCYANGFQVCECFTDNDCPAGKKCVRPATNTPRQCVDPAATKRIALVANTTVTEDHALAAAPSKPAQPYSESAFIQSLLEKTRQAEDRRRKRPLGAKAPASSSSLK